MKKKVGIIGIGALGEGMVDVFSKHPLVELVAVCDIDTIKVDECAAHYGIKGFYQYATMLEEAELDMVYVAVPPKWHHDIVVEVIRHGKHILCEKPLANSVEEALNMLNLAKEANIIHAMNFPLSYLNNTRKFEQLYSEGYIGKLRRVELTMQFPTWPRHWQQNSWINSREQGGFVFEVTGHFIQLIQRFFGKINHISSDLEFPDNLSLSETGIVANMRLSDNIPVILNGISGLAGLEEQNLTLTAYGTEGTISLIDLMKLRAGKIGEAFEFLEVENNHFWNELINEFVGAIDGKSSELYDFQVGYDVQVVLEALRNSQPDLIKTN